MKATDYPKGATVSMVTDHSGVDQTITGTVINSKINKHGRLKVFVQWSNCRAWYIPSRLTIVSPVKSATYTVNDEFSIEVDLNGASEIPTTKSGKQCVLRSHCIKMEGTKYGFESRLFTQPQVAAVKATGKWITHNDRDWAGRECSEPPKLVSAEELADYIKST